MPHPGRRKAFSLLIVMVMVSTSFGMISLSDDAKAETMLPATHLTVPWDGTGFVPDDMAWDSAGSNEVVVGADPEGGSSAWHRGSGGAWNEVLPPSAPPETYYVGSGVGNYSTTIQAAVDAARPGDTVHVWPGTYFENVLVNKAVYLRGHNRATTIVDGNGIGSIISVSASYAEVSNFSLTNTGAFMADVDVFNADFVKVADLDLSDSYFGVSTSYSDFLHIEGCYVFPTTTIGIYLQAYCNNSEVCHNNIHASSTALSFYMSNDNLAHNNTLSDAVNYGINIESSSGNVHRDNVISNNGWGVYIDSNDNNEFCHNIFLSNLNGHAQDSAGSNIWNLALPVGGNYWDDYGGSDANGDGIGDTPYAFAGGQDNLPWAIQSGWAIEDIGLVGEWHFDEGAGQYAYDSSAEGNTGTLGSTTAVDSYDPTRITGGISSGALDYNGDYVRVPDDASLYPNDYFTAEAWVKGPDFSSKFPEHYTTVTNIATQSQVVVNTANPGTVNLAVQTLSGTQGPNTATVIGGSGAWLGASGGIDGSNNVYASYANAVSNTQLMISLSPNNGGSYSTAQVVNPMKDVDSTITVGGLGQLWGLTWTPSSFTNANFLFRMAASDGAYQIYSGFGFSIPAGAIIDGIGVQVESHFTSVVLTYTRYVDFITVTVYYHTTGYYASGELVSRNLITSYAGLAAFESSVTSMPANTRVYALFSKDNVNWFNSAGGTTWEQLASGYGSISLAGLGWSSTAFYYKVQLTSLDGVSTAVLDWVNVTYTNTVSYPIISKDLSYEMRVSSQRLYGLLYQGGAWQQTSALITWKTGWNHCAFTSSGSTKVLYFNGAPIVTWSQAGGPATAVNNLYFGYCAGYPQLYLNASIDEVSMWKRTLSSGEILSRYKALDYFEGYTPIHDVAELQAIQGNLAGSYMLANDIDASATAGWGGGAGFTPIGSGASPFTGRFNGDNRTVSGVYVNSLADYAGLFGRISPTGVVENVNLLDMNITGAAFTGGLVGCNDEGTVANSSAGGDVRGTVEVGGLVGLNFGTISKSYSTADVAGTGNEVGGIAGYNSWNSYVIESYATGSVFGVQYVGGLVGWNFQGNIYNSYATGSVTAATNYAGGLLGSSDTGLVYTSYSTGSVTCPGIYTGGLMGRDISSDVNANLWDTVTSGKATSPGGTGKTTAEMMTQTTYTAIGWDFSTKWWMISGQTRPFLRMEWSQKVRNSHQLQMMNMSCASVYTLACDVDASDIVSPAQMWGTSLSLRAGFVPVGTSSMMFTGTLQGAYHTIRNLYVKRPSVSYQGLFGYVGATGRVYNVTLERVYVNGYLTVGGAVGVNYGIIKCVNVSGTVIGNYYNIGGIAGYNEIGGAIYRCANSANVTSLANNAGGITGYCRGPVSECSSTGIIQAVNYAGGIVAYMNAMAVTNCYSWGSVTATTNVAGGLAGLCTSGCSITNSYSRGTVSAPTNSGGLIGSNSGGTVTASYWDTETSGKSSSAGGTAKTTAQMKDHNTFLAVGWDFVGTWHMRDAVTYPMFQWQPLPLDTGVFQNFTGVAWEGVSNRFWACGDYSLGVSSSVYYVLASDFAHMVPVSAAPQQSLKAIAADDLGNVLVGGDGLPGLYYYDHVGSVWHTIVETGSGSMAQWNVTGITFNTKDDRFYVVGSYMNQQRGAAFFTPSVPLTAASKCTRDTSTFLDSADGGILRSIAWNQKSSMNYSIAVGAGVYRMAYNGTGTSLNWSVISPPEPGVASYYDVSWDSWGNATELIPAWDQACIVGGRMNITDMSYHGTFWRYYDSNGFFAVRHTDPDPGRYMTCAIKPPASPLYLYTFPDTGGGWEILLDSTYEGGEVTLNFNNPHIFSMTMYKSSDVTRSNLFNRQVDAGSTYTFLVEYSYVVSNLDCWDEASFSLAAWYDGGSTGAASVPEPTWSSPSHRTRQFCLNYSMASKAVTAYYPAPLNGMSEFFIQNVWEDPAVYGGTEYRHRIMINVTMGSQTYAATGSMNAAMNNWDKNMAFNDPGTWDLSARLFNPLNPAAVNYSYDEFGLKESASIISSGTPSGNAPPGSVDFLLSGSYMFYYSINTDYLVNISVSDLHLNGNEGDIVNRIPASNLKIRNSHILAPGNSEVVVMTAFGGPGDALYIWNGSMFTPLDAPLNGTQSAAPGYSDYSVGFDMGAFEATEVDWWITIPVGLAEGIYRAPIILTIGD